MLPSLLNAAISIEIPNSADIMCQILFPHLLLGGGMGCRYWYNIQLMYLFLCQLYIL